MSPVLPDIVTYANVERGTVNCHAIKEVTRLVYVLPLHIWFAWRRGIYVMQDRRYHPDRNNQFSLNTQSMSYRGGYIPYFLIFFKKSISYEGGGTSNWGGSDDVPF